MEPAPPVPETTSGARHALPVRLWHWVNAATLIVMGMSGLMILNAHPHLYWGQYGANFDHAWASFSRFPGWATIPSTYSLADARLWHLFFAWILALSFTGFLLWALLRGHFRRDIAPRAAELAPAHMWAEVRDHARLRFPPHGAPYNTLQKLTYLAVLALLLPLAILTGLTLSPGMDAAWPWLLDLFGGRQSARSLHFIAFAGLFAFLVIHVLLVLLAGPIGLLRGMITGRRT
ncbi:cytochrome b/b6 domain-containing protein [Parablastomonas sp. CN1-191]|uniref:cytochrome b/b6 domain-containing protein n=1 Tax=Parablastomonas sp. CN1-191 TaxID=3400908 RepID=UPI003BF8499B